MPNWSVFLPAAFLMAMIPGANQVLGMRNAALYGMRSAVTGVAGRFAAFAILVLLVVVGLGAVLARSVVVFELIRWAGVAYLLWLGISTLRRAGHDATESASERVRPRDAARREFITALSNPKALLLFVSFLPQFLPRPPSGASLLLVAVAYVGVEAVAAVAYLSVGTALRRQGGRLRVSPKRLDQVAGISFLGFGGWLATTGRP